jgi:hypothetical protein
MTARLKASVYKYNIKILDSLVPLNACLVTFDHKCGKPNCKCTQGHLHQSTALKYRVNGVQKKKYVKKSDVDRVRRKLYQAKGIEILERDDKYIFSIAYKYPDLFGADIHIKAYEVFGQQKRSPESFFAN